MKLFYKNPKQFPSFTDGILGVKWYGVLDNIKTKGQRITITAKTLEAAMAEPHIEGKPATVARRLNRKEHKTS